MCTCGLWKIKTFYNDSIITTNGTKHYNMKICWASLEAENFFHLFQKVMVSLSQKMAAKGQNYST